MRKWPRGQPNKKFPKSVGLFGRLSLTPSPPYLTFDIKCEIRNIYKLFAREILDPIIIHSRRSDAPKTNRIVAIYSDQAVKLGKGN